MYYQFATDSLKHAKAALVLYALYRSRDASSPLNGVETWDRFNSFCRGACLKSSSLPEFIQAFCRKAKVESIRPQYLDTGDPVELGDGEMISASGVHNYNMDILGDNTLLDVIRNETMYLSLLIRERIQREKLNNAEED